MDAERTTFGQYTVLAPIGDDSMLVQRAAEAGFARLLVIRALHDNGNAGHEIEHTLSQAKLAARLQHPNVRQIHEVGKLEGQHYIAFEYLEGIGFDQLLAARNRGPQLADPRLFCALLAQACEGLHQAHRARIPGKTTIGLIHGCLRPERLFVTSGGTVKLLGFGLRDLLSTGNPQEMSQPERYAYMAPEQVLGRQADIRSDVFSMGVLAWESLTGRRLFARANRVEVLRAITQNPIPPPNALSPAIPPPLNHVVVRALSRNPDERFQTARELGIALEEGVAGIGAALSTVAIAAMVDRFFATELEAQRSIVLKARRDLESAMGDDLEVPTRIFEGDTDIDFNKIRPTAVERPMTNRGHGPQIPPGRAKSETAPQTPRAKTANGSSNPPAAGRQYERPPDTLSDVGEVPDLDRLPKDHSQKIAAMIEDVASAAPDAGYEPLTSPELPPVGGRSKPATGTAQVAPGSGRMWLTVLLVLILAAAAGAAGYVYWIDQHSVSE